MAKNFARGGTLLLMVVLAVSGTVCAVARLQRQEDAGTVGAQLQQERAGASRHLQQADPQCESTPDKPNYCDHIAFINHRCVNVQDDNDNCGRCDNKCGKWYYCDKGQCVKGGAAKWCFPGHALALLPGGLTRRMDQLSLGDTVAVRRLDGSVGYEPIYVWGHRHAGIKGQFVQADLVPVSTATGGMAALGDTAAVAAADGKATLQLELTPGHFAMTVLPGGAVGPKLASEIVAGDRMLVATTHQDGSRGITNSSTDMQLQQWVVAAVRSVHLEAGMYSPYTMGGNLLVNGVLASSHSLWYADALFGAWGLPPSWLPALYQATLAPPRALWHLLGQERYVEKYEAVDARVDISDQCTRRGLLGYLHVLATVLVMLLADAVSAAWLLAWQSVGGAPGHLVQCCTYAAAVAVVSGMVVAVRSKPRHLKTA